MYIWTLKTKIIGKEIRLVVTIGGVGGEEELEEGGQNAFPVIR